MHAHARAHAHIRLQHTAVTNPLHQCCLLGPEVKESKPRKAEQGREVGQPLGTRRGDKGVLQALPNLCTGCWCLQGGCTTHPFRLVPAAGGERCGSLHQLPDLACVWAVPGAPELSTTPIIPRDPLPLPKSDPQALPSRLGGQRRLPPDLLSHLWVRVTA